MNSIPPSEAELSALREQVVQLTINQSTIYSNWIKFAITVQAGLAAGLGFVLKDAKYAVFGLMIAFFGIATAILFAAILRRHAQWSVWYVERWKCLATTSEIFPTRPGEIAGQKLGPVAWSVVGFLLLVALAWIVIFTLVLFKLPVL
jgi:hypothetical protein